MKMKAKMFAIIAALVMVAVMIVAVPVASEDSSGAAVKNCSGECGHEAAIGTTHYDTLQDAIDAATEGQTVNLLKEITVTDKSTNENTGVFAISKKITINGNGNTIKANDFATGTYSDGSPMLLRHLFVVSAGATIQNLTIIGDSTVKHGINLFNAADAPTLSNVTVKSCGGYGILISTCEAKLTGNISLQNNGWGNYINLAHTETENSKKVSVDLSEIGTLDVDYFWTDENDFKNGKGNFSIIAKSESVIDYKIRVINNGSEELDVISHAVSIVDGENTVYYPALNTAISNVGNNGTITLTGNVFVNETVNIADKKNITIDLKGHNICTVENFDKNTFTVDQAYLKLTGTGTITKTSDGDYYNIIIKGSSNNTSGYHYGLYIDKDVIINTNEGINSYGFQVCENNGAAYGVKVEVYGTIDTEYGATVNGNVVKTDGNIPHIIIGDGANFIGGGLYAAGYAKYDLTNATIDAVEYAVEIRAGELTITGGTYSCTAEFTGGANTSGSTIEGSAIAVSHHTTNASIKVIINSGTFTGAYALYENDYHNDPPSLNVQVTLNGGTYNGEVSSSNKKLTINGGTFSSNVKEYLAEGESLEVIDGKYTVVSKFSDNVVAQVGDVGYTTLEDAIAAALSSGDVILLQNYYINGEINVSGVKSFEIVSGKTLEIGSNGKFITGTNVVENNGTIEFKGSIVTSGDTESITGIINNGSIYAIVSEFGESCVTTLNTGTSGIVGEMINDDEYWSFEDTNNIDVLTLNNYVGNRIFNFADGSNVHVEVQGSNTINANGSVDTVIISVGNTGTLSIAESDDYIIDSSLSLISNNDEDSFGIKAGSISIGYTKFEATGGNRGIYAVNSLNIVGAEVISSGHEVGIRVGANDNKAQFTLTGTANVTAKVLPAAKGNDQGINDFYGVKTPFLEIKAGATLTTDGIIVYGEDGTSDKYKVVAGTLNIKYNELEGEGKNHTLPGLYLAPHKEGVTLNLYEMEISETGIINVDKGNVIFGTFVTSGDSKTFGKMEGAVAYPIKVTADASIRNESNKIIFTGETAVEVTPTTEGSNNATYTYDEDVETNSISFDVQGVNVAINTSTLEDGDAISVTVIPGTVYSDSQAFEIVIMNGNETLTGKIKITLPVNPAKSNPVVYWLKDDGTKVEMNIIDTTSTTVTFTTDHNSMYIVEYKSSSGTGSGTTVVYPSANESTGLDQNVTFIAGVFILVFAILGFACMIRKL